LALTEPLGAGNHPAPPLHIAVVVIGDWKVMGQNTISLSVIIFVKIGRRALQPNIYQSLRRENMKNTILTLLLASASLLSQATVTCGDE
jgi:hypothetical protein